MIPIESCSNCVMQNFELLSVINCNKIRPIIIGKAFKEKVKNQLSKVVNEYPSLLRDEKNEAIDYQLGLFKPKLIHLKNKKLIYHKGISDFDVKEVKIYVIILSRD